MFDMFNKKDVLFNDNEIDLLANNNNEKFARNSISRYYDLEQACIATDKNNNNNYCKNNISSIKSIKDPAGNYLLSANSLSEAINNKNTNQNNLSLSSNSNEMNDVVGGFNPLLQKYVRYTNIIFKKEENASYLEYDFVNGELIAKEYSPYDADFSKITNLFLGEGQCVDNNGYSNPFAKILLTEEQDASNYHFLNTDILTDDPLDHIYNKDTFNYRGRQFVVNKTHSYKSYFDRDILREMDFDRYNAKETFNQGISDKMVDISLLQQRSLLLGYKNKNDAGLFNNTKFSDARTLVSGFAKDFFDKVYKVSGNEQSLSAMSDADYIKACENFAIQISIMLNNAKLSINDEIVFTLDDYTCSLLSSQYLPAFNNGTSTGGFLYQDKFDRLSYLMMIVKKKFKNFKIVKIAGSCKESKEALQGNNIYNTLLADNSSLKRVNYFYVKKYFQYVNLLPLKAIVNGKVVDANLQDLNQYVQVSPTDYSCFVVSNVSDVITPKMSLNGSNFDFAIKFELNV